MLYLDIQRCSIFLAVNYLNQFMEENLTKYPMEADFINF